MSFWTIWENNGDKKTDKLAAQKSNLYYEYVSNNFYLQVRKIDKKVFNNY